MQNSLHIAGQMTSGGAFYESDSDNEKLVGDNASESADDNIGDQLQAGESADQAETANAAAPAPDTKQSLIPAKSAFDFPSANGASLQPFAELFGLAMRNGAFTPAMLNLNPPGTKTKTFKLVFNGTIDDLQSGADLARLVPEVKNIGMHFGGSTIPATEIAITEYDFSGWPITVGIKAPDHFNAASHNHISIAGPVLFEAKKLSKEKFASPLIVHVGVESDFKKRMATEFQGVNEKNVADCITSSTKAGFVLVPYKTLAARAVEDEIAHQKKLAKAEGKQYTGPELKKIDDLSAYEVPKVVANVAMNVLIASIVKTNDTFNIDEKLYLEFVRTVLSPATVQTMKSANAKLWNDQLELMQSTKAGMSLEAITKSKFTGSITVAVKYNCPDEKK
jgi:hypothetical protein